MLIMCSLLFILSKKTADWIWNTREKSLLGELCLGLKNLFHDPGDVLCYVQKDGIVIFAMTFWLHWPKRRDASREPAPINFNCEATAAVATASCGPIFIPCAEIFTRHQIASKGQAVSSLEALFVGKHWQIGFLKLGRKGGFIVHVTSGTKTYNLRTE